jgi:hypothetical protein
LPTVSRGALDRVEGFTDEEIDTVVTDGLLRWPPEPTLRRRSRPRHRLAAAASGVGDRKGRLRAGYDADVVVVNGDMTDDIARLGNVRSVMLGGEFIAGQGSAR